MLNKPNLKFRPSLSLTEIQHILHHLPPTGNDALRRKLEVFTIKAEHGIASPSHVAIGKQSLESSLGFSADDTMAQLLALYQTTPQLLSVTQLTRVQHHRYLNDLMSPEEEAQYEQRTQP